jgi:hypothetical protein
MVETFERSCMPRGRARIGTAQPRNWHRCAQGLLDLGLSPRGTVLIEPEAIKHRFAPQHCKRFILGLALEIVIEACPYIEQ